MQWRRHFQQSVARERHIDWDRGITLPEDLKGPAILSFQALQRGLSSPGNDLRTKVRQQCAPEYAEAIDLYVKEKNIHADQLAKWLWAAGSRPGKRTLTDFAFRRMRRRFDWAGELKVLLTAEMATVPLFRIFANNIDCLVTHQVVEAILDDQAYHLGFHIDHLREEMEQRSGRERAILQQTWGAFFATVLGAVLADNHEFFAALGYDKLAFWTDAWNLFAQVQTGLNGSAHLGAVLGRDPRIQFAL